jgi:hypothetical protein
MTQELSCFYFPYFVVPDDLLKLGILYFDKVYIDTLSEETLNVALRHLIREGPLAKYALGQVRAIEGALERHETQMAAWRTAGLLDSGIIVPSSYEDRLDSLPREVMDELEERGQRLITQLPEDVAAGLIKLKLKVWHMAGAYKSLLIREEDEPAVSIFDERMPVEIEEEFQGLELPEEAFVYRSEPLVEGPNAAKVARLRSVQGYGPNTCFMPAYLPLLVEGVTPWVADPTAEKLLTYYFPRRSKRPVGASRHALQAIWATKALRFALPSLSFRSYEEVLEARYLCRDALGGYRNYMAQLVRELETREEPIVTEEIPKILLQRLDEEIKDLKTQVHETSRGFLRDAVKRASPILTTLGIQLYMNTPLVGVIGAALGSAVAAAVSAYEAHMARKRLLHGKRAHGLSFLLRLQRSLE